MNTILASILLLAASLTSETVDTFFTMPSWMPESVTSANTPGSDPASGEGGWYVEEMTNEVMMTDAWTVTTDDGFRIDDFDQIIYWNDYENGWGVLQAYDQYISSNGWYIIEFDPAETFPQYIDGDPSDDYLEWNGEQLAYYDHQGATNLSYAYDIPFEAVRTTYTTNVPTGRYVPRSPRLTPDVMAGVYSTFEAYCERQYFALQGQSNVWDTAIYGPTTRKQFRFMYGTTTNITTNVVWDAETNFGRFYNRIYLWNEPQSTVRKTWYVDLIGNSIKTILGYPDSYYAKMTPEYYGNYETQEINIDSRLDISRWYGYEPVFSTNVSIHATRTDYITTNIYYNEGCEFGYIPENRTVRTRRLVEYNNICGLADYIVDYWGDGFFLLVGAQRPGWIDLEYDDYAETGRGWWSTTDDRVFTGTRIVPSFGWMKNPKNLDWSKCSQAFTCLTNDEVWGVNFGEYPVSRQPLYEMMENIDFEEPGRLHGIGASRLSTTFKEMIETNYPHADGWAITNDTRRLFSDRLCCMNQVLGLMDRTYHEPRVIYPNVATNYSYYNEWGCRGEQEVGCVPSYDPETGETIYEIVPSTVSNYVWETWRETNWLERTDAPTDGKAIYHRVSTSSTSSGCGFSVEPSYTCGLTKEDIENGLNYFAPNTTFTGTFDTFAVFDSIIEYAYYVGVWTAGEDPQTIHMFFPARLPELESNVTIRADYTYIRNYNVKHPHSEDPDIKYTFGPTQPGRDAYQTSRVKAARAGLVNGVHYREIDCGLSTLPWNTSGEGASTAAYSSEEFNYSSRYDLVLKANSYLGGAYNYAISFWGHDPHNWEDIIPIDSADATRCRGVAGCLNSACLKWGSNVEIVEQHFSAHTDSEGIATVDWVETWYNEGGRTNVWVDDFIPTHHLNVFGESPEPYENPAVVRKPFSIDIKAGTMTRTDWNWKTLKRGND